MYFPDFKFFILTFGKLLDLLTRELFYCSLTIANYFEVTFYQKHTLDRHLQKI